MENKWGLMSELGVVIPTYNAGGQLEQRKRLTIRRIPPDQIS